MMLAALLLIAPMASPALQESLAPEATPRQQQAPLPAVGSEAAKAAEQAWSSWISGLPTEPSVPLHAAYQLDMKGKIAAEGENHGFQIGLASRSDYRSLQVMRHHFVFTVTLDQEDAVEVEVDLLFDGDTIWLLADSSDVELVPEGGFLARADQHVLENLYDLYLESLPALSGMLELQQQGMTAMLSSMTDLMPADFGSYLHPAVYLRSYDKMVTCRRFRVVEGMVEANLSLDLSPGSPVGEMLDFLDLMMLQLGDQDPDVHAMAVGIREMLGSLSYHVTVEESSGIPLGMNMNLKMSTKDFGISQETFAMNMELAAAVSGKVSHPQKLADELFAAPKSAAQALDVTMFLQMAQGQLQALVAQAKSEEEDVAF